MNDIKLMNKAADNIRILAASMVEKANSGHPGGAMGGADFGRCAGYSDHKVAQAEQTCAFGVSIFAAVAPYIYAKIEDTQRTIG